MVLVCQVVKRPLPRANLSQLWSEHIDNRFQLQGHAPAGLQSHEYISGCHPYLRPQQPGRLPMYGSVLRCKCGARHHQELLAAAPHPTQPLVQGALISGAESGKPNATTSIPTITFSVTQVPREQVAQVNTPQYAYRWAKRQPRKWGTRAAEMRESIPV